MKEKRANKVNIVLSVMMCMIVGVQAIISLGIQGGMLTLIEAVAVALVLIGVYYIPKLNEKVKGMLICVIPYVVLLGIMLFIDGFTLDTHYTIYVVIMMIGLYLDTKMVIVFSLIFNVFWIAGYIISPANLLGEANDIFTFIQILLTINTVIVAIYFMTKWGDQLIIDAETRSALVEEISHKQKTILEQVENVGTSIGKHVSVVDDNTKESSLIAQQISTTMKQITEGVEQQTGSIMTINESMKDTEIKMSSTLKSTETIASQSVQLADEMQVGAKRMKDMTNQMSIITETVELSTQTVTDLGGQIKDISGLLVAIQSIADQSNLLALNAAIEAARAGESGRGFAVVAGEIRILSENSKNMVEAIQGILKDIEVKAENAVGAVEKGNVASEEGKIIIDEVSRRFGHLEQLVTNSQEEIENNVTNMKELEEVFGSIYQQIETIVSITEEHTAATEEVDSSIQRQNLDIQSLAMETKELATLADTLYEVCALVKN